MVEELCKACNNYFIKSKHFGKFTITNGSIAPLGLQAGQYFRIINSVFNDGVYQYPAVLTDETFEGAVLAMAIPQSFLALAAEIKQWQDTNTSTASSPLVSESYPNGYSYTVATGADGAPLKWQSVFAKEIAKWRKL